MCLIILRYGCFMDFTGGKQLTSVVGPTAERLSIRHSVWITSKIRPFEWRSHTQQSQINSQMQSGFDLFKVYRLVCQIGNAMTDNNSRHFSKRTNKTVCVTTEPVNRSAHYAIHSGSERMMFHYFSNVRLLFDRTTMTLWLIAQTYARPILSKEHESVEFISASFLIDIISVLHAVCCCCRRHRFFCRHRRWAFFSSFQFYQKSKKEWKIEMKCR